MSKKEDSWLKGITKSSGQSQSPTNGFPLKKVQEGYDFLKRSQYQKDSTKNTKNQLDD